MFQDYNANGLVWFGFETIMGLGIARGIALGIGT